MNIFSIIKLVVLGLPGLIQLAEGLFGAGKGKEKLGYVVELVKQVLSFTPWSKELEEGIVQIVSGLVAVFNATGFFQKGAK